jgi:hypothetical protein
VLDAASYWVHDSRMKVTPLPWRGGVQSDIRDEGRALRIAPHPRQDLVSLSLWRADACIATHQMSPAEVSQLINLLSSALSVLLEPNETATAS